jgi:radical SAM superfamily enzyme YgiQ (UPF0313 family)
MNVLVISTNQSVSPMPVLPAGACRVAEAAERAGHSVTMLDLVFQADPVRAVQARLRENAYDVIGLSVRNIDNNDLAGTRFYIQELVPLITAVRKLTDAPLVLGGAALGVMPEEILRALDVSLAVIGDGEVTFPRLLDRMARGESWEDLPGLAMIQGGIFRSNAGSAPASLNCAAPDYGRWVDLRSYRSQLATVPLQTSLGCGFRCVYCTYPKIQGTGYRLADPGQAAEAAQDLVSRGLLDIEFVDNVFNAPYDHAMNLCESFIRKKVNARFQSLELNPARFDDRLLISMERAGFVGMGLTVESTSDPVLEGLRKGFTSRDVFRAAEIVRRHRIPCVWIFMLGGPGETESTIRETIRFAGQHIREGDAAFFNIGIRIYPGTELETIARRQGVLKTRAEDMLDPVFYLAPGLTEQWVSDEVKSAMNSRLNFMSTDTFSFPFLPLVNKLAYRAGLRSPLFRYTRPIRRGLRFFGMDV